MCGYIFLKSNNKKDHLTINKEIPKIIKRGPDQTNIIKTDDKTLIHTRLSIVDLENGSQPMKAVFNNISYWILFNGEIYNHLELKEILKENYSFQTNSDTEVLLAAYINWGDKCLDKIIGMYSFVISSDFNDEIFCARDITGQKPLFYSFENQKLVISSIPIRFDQKKNISKEAIADFLINGYLTNNKSILDKVFSLDPGHSLSIKNNVLKKSKYWDIKKFLKPNQNKKYLNKIDLILEKIVNNYKNQADVPIALLLSGGIDSSLLLKYFKNKNIDCFTLDTEDEDSELNAAKSYVNKKNHKIIKSNKIDAQYFEYVYGNIFSQPFSDSSALNTAQLIRELSRNYKCAIGGDGADEIFAGYQSRIMHLGGNYLYNFEYYRRIISQYFSRIKNNYYKRKLFISGYRYPIFDLKNIKKLLKLRISSKSLFNYKSENIKTGKKERVLLEDFITYLPNNINIKLDEISMHYGVELRSPYQDRRIIEYSLSIPAVDKFNKNTSKILLRKIHSKYFKYNSYLIKKGFGMNYYNFLKRKDMEDLYKKYIKSKSKIGKLINISYMEKLLNRNYSARRWNFLCLAIWIEKNT